MSSDFVNYTRQVLTLADHTALAAALTTIYRDGVEYFPGERDWDGFYWNAYSGAYSIGLKPIDRSYIINNIAERKGDHKSYHSKHRFSVNTNRQAVTWKYGKNAMKVTPVPETFRRFFRKLTATVHHIHVERTEALKLKLKAEEEAKNAERDRKRKMVEAEKERNEQVAQAPRERVSKHTLLCRKVELEDALCVMRWKAAAAAEVRAAHDIEGTPTELTRKMLESAKRGRKHDLCVVCGERLRYCAHEGCNSIGCVKCYKAELTMCINCCSIVYCAKPVGDLNECSRCERLLRVSRRCGRSDISLNRENHRSSSVYILPRKPKEEK